MNELYNQLINDVLEYDSVNESKSLIEIDELDLTEYVHTSFNFNSRDELLKNLFNDIDNSVPNRIDIIENSSGNLNSQKDSATQISDRVVIQGWKNIENISARLIEFSEDQIVLECLIDKENKTYEERVFRPSLFVNYKLDIGNLFYLRFFERPNEIKMEVHDDPSLTSKDDFPKLEFVKEFKNSKLFRKKGN